MEKYSRVVCALIALSVPTTAHADPPTTTVWFGVPAAPVDSHDVPSEPRPADSRPAQEVPETRSELTTAAPRLEASAQPPAAPRPRAEAECPRAITLVRRRGARVERLRMPLLDCDGQPRDEARRALSVMARSRTVEEPPTDDEIRAWREADGDPEHLTERVRLLHPGLLERLQRIGEAFDPHPIEIVSGHRPESSPRSRHHHGHALDLVVQGVPREAVRDLAVTFAQTGVGWYPNSVFVHVDVRDESTYWVDLSGPGERPRYVRGATPPTPGDDPDEREGAAEATPSPEELERIRRETAEALRGIRLLPE